MGMKYYVQVLRPEADGQWQQVNQWTNQAAAIQDAKHTYGNPDHPASRNVMAVRVVRGKRQPVVVFERLTS
jgi:hypothetical protein